MPRSPAAIRFYRGLTLFAIVLGGLISGLAIARFGQLGEIRFLFLATGAALLVALMVIYLRWFTGKVGHPRPGA